MRRIRWALALVLILATGCLGTVVESPRRQGRPISTTRVHIIAAPIGIDAHVCERGIAAATSFVPIWGVAVGILTLGILVPKTIVYNCVQGS